MEILISLHRGTEKKNDWNEYIMSEKMSPNEIFMFLINPPTRSLKPKTW